MKHECASMNKEQYKVYFEGISKEWVIEEMIEWGPPHESVAGIRFCPFCGVTLND